MLTKTGIEYGDFSWNPYPGCKHGADKCPVTAHCWAAGMAKRQRFNFREPRLIPERLLDPLRRKKPARILVNFMGDLGGDWVDPEAKVSLSWVDRVALASRLVIPEVLELGACVHAVVTAAHEHEFVFLSKCPESFKKWGEWPDNCWMGASAWDWDSYWTAIGHLDIVKCKHRWLSIEPLLDCIGGPGVLDELLESGIEWVVIGAQTRPDVMPKIEWIREVVKACDAAGVKVWLKDNLRPLFQPMMKAPNMQWWGNCFGIRQELPGLR